MTLLLYTLENKTNIRTGMFSRTNVRKLNKAFKKTPYRVYVFTAIAAVNCLLRN